MHDSANATTSALDSGTERRGREVYRRHHARAAQELLAHGWAAALSKRGPRGARDFPEAALLTMRQYHTVIAFRAFMLRDNDKHLWNAGHDSNFVMSRGTGHRRRTERGSAGTRCRPTRRVMTSRWPLRGDCVRMVF